MHSVHPINETESFDFRSLRFDADARMLERATGRSLVSCRQELFMTEGDMALAYQVLTKGYGCDADHPTLH